MRLLVTGGRRGHLGGHVTAAARAAGHDVVPVGTQDADLRDAYEALAVTVNPIPVKTALALLGLDPGNFRLPMVPASPDEETAVRSMLERHGLLSAV